MYKYIYIKKKKGKKKTEKTEITHDSLPGVNDCLHICTFVLLHICIFACDLPYNHLASIATLNVQMKDKGKDTKGKSYCSLPSGMVTKLPS